MDNISSDLLFNLKNMTKAELMENLYLDDDVEMENFEVQSIPSDSDSLVQEDVISDTDDLNDDQVPSPFSDSDDDLEEDIITLKELQSRLLDKKRQLQNATTVLDSLNWNKSNPPFSNILDFTSASGVPDFIQNDIDHSPGSIFQYFFSNEFIDLLVFQTNLYAQQLAKPYKPTDNKEIKTFLGINLLMGVKRLPSYRDYWSSNKILHDSFISSLMPVKRFSWLLATLHLNNNLLQPQRNTPNFDKLYKVRPLINHLQDRFSSCFQLSKNIAVDESMIKYKGRSTIKQYMPKKPIKRGYKVWMLADQTGYCYKFEIYTGKTGDGVQKDLGSTVIKTLCLGLENKGHCLFFDNYFNSVPLMIYLQEKQIFACGTVNQTRKYLPSFLQDSKMKRGEFDFYTSNNGMLALKWKDKRAVSLLSNYHDSHETSTVKRKNKDGTVEDVLCPQLLIDYNKFMNGVDKFDQIKSTYEVDRKSHKWWHRIFFFFLDASIVNAFIIYKELNLEKMTMKDFRLAVAEYLISAPNIKKRCSDVSSPITIKKHKPFVPPTTRHSEANHQPTYSTRRRCALCSTKENQIRTNWFCSICRVPLCMGKQKHCFQEYHAR